MTCVVASGSGDTSRTGKSLMTNMWQIVFDGKKTSEGTMSITEAAIYKQLDKGLPVYSKYCLNFVLSNRNTPTGASTNPKNFNLNKNLNMNLI